MKIYFAGSIKGGRGHWEWYKHTIDMLQEHGEVLTEFVSDKTLTSYGTPNMTDVEIYDRDVDLLQKADILVADVTTPSLGVGYEIGYAENLNKKIYCLYKEIPGKRISSMITGNPNCEIHKYETIDDLKQIMGYIFK